MEKDGAVLWLRQILANSATKLTAPANGSFWAFAIAPDNSYVYYIFNNVAEPQKSGLYKMPLLGGEPQRIAENVGTLAISPDSRRLVLVRGGETTEVFTVNTNGEDKHTVMNLPADARLWSVKWTPDGSALLCTIRKTVADKNLYYVAEVSPETGNEIVVLPAQERIVYGAEWLPDKSALIIVVREANADVRQIWQYFPAAQDWRRITNDNNYYQSVDVTRDGKTIVSSQTSRLAAIWLAESSSPEKNAFDKKLSVMNRDDFRQITDGINNFDKLGWLSDGRLIYTATEDGREIIFTVNADGTNARQISSGEDGMWIFPTVACNGQSVCFLSSRSGSRQVWRVDADGKNLTKITETSFPISSARILHDNLTVIYLSQNKSGEQVLFKQSPDGQTVQLTESGTGSWAISPDEKLLAFEFMDKSSRKYRIELRSLENGKTIKTFDFSPYRQMSFTPDGKSLAYDVTHGDVSQIMLQSIEGGEPLALTDFQTDEIFSFDWSADKTPRLALIRGKQLNDAVIIKASDK
jgi:Tol biopolymer transport system component